MSLISTLLAQEDLSYKTFNLEPNEKLLFRIVIHFSGYNLLYLLHTGVTAKKNGI